MVEARTLVLIDRSDRNQLRSDRTLKYRENVHASFSANESLTTPERQRPDLHLSRRPSAAGIDAPPESSERWRV